MAENTDFKVENHGTIFLLRPLNDAAREHMEEHLGEGSQLFAGAVAVEHRYIHGLVAELQSSGFTVV